MHGNDRVRFCDQCRLHVYNLSDMPRFEAETLVNETEGRLCIAYYQRSDGTILTRDCPVGLRLARAAALRAVRVAAAVTAICLAVLAWIGQTAGNTRLTELRSLEPFRSVQAWLVPASPWRGQMVMGKIAIPPAQRTQIAKVTDQLGPGSQLPTPSPIRKSD